MSEVIGGELGTTAGEVPPELQAELAESGEQGTSPWRLGWRRLRRNKAAIASGIIFLLLVASTIAAPIWANEVAHKTPYETPPSDETVEVDGEQVFVIGLDGIPVGPTWDKKYFLGADGNGRDVMVRLLYGGRNSLLIGIGAALVTTILAIGFGLLGGYLRGWTDGVIARLMDILWAFPVILLGVALGTALALGGFKAGPVTIESGSLLIPMFVISVVYIPYMARPVRGEVLALREKEFVEAARAQGMGPLRIMFGEILPNTISLVVVFFPLMVANAILLEAALSFLGAGVQAPEPSWGTMIDDGVDRIITAPYLAIVPGAMLVATVIALNIFGDGVRDALDPRAKVRIEG
ncbi:MAG: ABC transporter permease [Solirubrobacterales bacterium]